MTLPAEFPTPRARATDRQTSHNAAIAAKAKAPTIRDAVLETVRLYWPNKAFTLLDVVDRYMARAGRGNVPDTTDSSIRTRVSELARAGLIQDTQSSTIPDGHHVRHTLWALTPAGKES